MEDGDGVHRGQRSVLGVLPQPGLVVSSRACKEAGYSTGLSTQTSAQDYCELGTGFRRISINPRAASDDVSPDALVVLHVLPPGRQRAVRPRAHGQALPEGRNGAGGQRALLVRRSVRGGSAAVHAAVQRAAAAARRAAARHPPVLHHARLLPLLAERTRSRGEPPVEQPPRASGQQIRQRASGPPPFVPLSLPQCSILLHQQELALLPPHGQTGRS